MIASFRHCGLERLYAKDDASKVSRQDVKRLRLILAALDAAHSPHDLDIHVFHLHPLRGDLKGYWVVTVRANWRVIFRFEEGEACDVDLVDHH